MPMFVANNLNALNIQHALSVDENRMSKSLERISTGYKINSGKDDPSGLVISEQLRAQNVGLERAVQNTQEANNVLGIAEGALNEMNSILKKMRQLAVHSANNGVTSVEQVAADQAEIDSSVQTLDRIARTTKFSDQNLLNGNKELSYSSNTLITDSKDMKLVNEDLSDIRQIFKKDDFKLNINFSGSGVNAEGETVDNGNEAAKGYFEISRIESEATQVDASAELTKDQAFTISGNKGGRYVSFAKGTHLGEMVESINSVSGSTGVKATLVFESDTTVAGVSSSDVSLNGVVTAGLTEVAGTAAHSSGMADVFNMTSLGAATTDGVSSIAVDSTNGIRLGENVDGHGRAYLKMVDSDSYEIYKDAAMTMKVAQGDVDGSGDTQVMAVNNSGLTGLDFTFGSDLEAGATAVIQLGVEMEDVGITNKSMTVIGHQPPNVNTANDSTGNPGEVASVVVTSGRLPLSMANQQYAVSLNTNTNTYELRANNAFGALLASGSNGSFDQAAGTITADFSYGGESFSISVASEAGIGAGATWASGVCSFIVNDVSENDGLDMTGLEDDTNVTTDGSFFVSSGSYFSGVSLGDNTSDMGKLYIKADLNAVGTSSIYAYKDARMRDEDLVAQSAEVEMGGSVGGTAVRMFAAGAGGSGATSGLYGTLNFNQITQDVDLNGSVVEFTNFGMRVSAEEYGADSFVKIDQHEGAIFTHYSDLDGAVLLDAGLDGEDWVEYGRDATVSLNGQEMKLNGVEGEIASLDTTAKIAFNSGGLGVTTIAAVGYDEGAWAARAGQINNDEGNHINHALHSTTESLGDWSGGMQFQLGEGAGDQERTVLSLKDMTATELGKVDFVGSFESALDSERTLSVNDMLSGGWASLSADPVKALEIIDKAIEDVSELRANIGAFQANMLETNANSLNVAIENITKTESYIRDADMARESTEFSKNQIMVQAGTSMLAQANQLGRNALSLIG